MQAGDNIAALMPGAEQTEVRCFRPGVLGIVVCSILILAALAILLARSPNPSPASIALDRKLGQLRDDGVPLTAAQMGELLPDPDPEHDARLVFQSVFAPVIPASTNLPVVGPHPFPPRHTRVDADVMSAMASYLTNSDAMLAAFPGELDGVRFSMGWSNGFVGVTPLPFIQVRKVAQALVLKALYEAEGQHPQKAADALRAGFGLGNTLNGDSLVSSMIRVAVLGLNGEATEQVLNRAELTEAQLLSLQQRINPVLADDFNHAYAAERYMAVNFFAPLRAAHTKGGSMTAKSMLLNWLHRLRNRKPIYRDEDYLLYLNILDERRATQSLPGVLRLQRSEQLDAKYKTNSSSTAADMIGTHWSKATRSAIETRAKLENAKAALAVQRYRLLHKGALPDSLAALVPQFLPGVPVDPFDHQPLRFKKLPRGYIVYSIGADGVDNGGLERTNSNATTNYDVTFTLER